MCAGGELGGAFGGGVPADHDFQGGTEEFAGLCKIRLCGRVEEGHHTGVRLLLEPVENGDFVGLADVVAGGLGVLVIPDREFAGGEDLEIPFRGVGQAEFEIAVEEGIHLAPGNGIVIMAELDVEVGLHAIRHAEHRV